MSTEASSIIAPASQVVMQERCFYCSHFFSPSDLRKIGGVVNMCVKCQHQHVKNMMEFVPPPYCQECMTTVEALAARGADRMAVHYKDGIYQVLCLDCDAKYVQQRADLYKQTPFGHGRKL